jgi:hypothetical protein
MEKSVIEETIFETVGHHPYVASWEGPRRAQGVTFRLWMFTPEEC